MNTTTNLWIRKHDNTEIALANGTHLADDYAAQLCGYDLTLSIAGVTYAMRTPFGIRGKAWVTVTISGNTVTVAW